MQVSIHAHCLLTHVRIHSIPWNSTRLRLGFDWISMDDGWQRCNCSVRQDHGRACKRAMAGVWSSKVHQTCYWYVDLFVTLSFWILSIIFASNTSSEWKFAQHSPENCHFHTMLCNLCCWLSTGPGSKLAQVWWQFVLWGALLLARQSRPTHGAERSLPRHVPLLEVCIIILHLWWLPPAPAQQHKIFLHFLAFQNNHDVCESVGANQSFAKGCELSQCLSVTQCDSF